MLRKRNTRAEAKDATSCRIGGISISQPQVSFPFFDKLAGDINS
jgi:hypothetical protein